MQYQTEGRGAGAEKPQTEIGTQLDQLRAGLKEHEMLLCELKGRLGSVLAPDLPSKMPCEPQPVPMPPESGLGEMLRNAGNDVAATSAEVRGLLNRIRL